jgi:type II secretory pathway pseudopilin PulG
MRGEDGFGIKEVVIVVVLVGVTAGVAYPQWLRARVSANESAMIGDTRTMISAQASYASSNAHMYESDVTCLAEPSRCIPGYPASAPIFLEPALAANRSTHKGFKRSFTGLCSGSCQVADDKGKLISSKTSADTYTFVGLPEQPGRGGVHAFCADDSGVICYEADGKPENLVDTEGLRCKPGCSPMC